MSEQLLYIGIFPLSGMLFLMLQCIGHEFLEMKGKIKELVNRTMSHDTHWFPDKPADDYTNGF